MLKEEIRKEIFESLENSTNALSKEDIIICLEVWENNEFVKAPMKEIYVSKTKEELVDLLITNLKSRYDVFTMTYVTLMPNFLKDDTEYSMETMDIVESVFENFGFTNEKNKNQLKRQNVVDLMTNEDLKNEVYDFIEDQVINTFDLEDEEVQPCIDTVFIKVLFELLYVECSELDYLTFKQYLQNQIKEKEDEGL